MLYPSAHIGGEGPSCTADELGFRHLQAEDRALTKAINAVKSQRSMLRRKMNALVPFSRLPLETFSGILVEVMHSRSRLYFQKLYQLRQVSVGFRDAIDGTPRLWNILCSSVPLPVTFRALDLSRSLPLKICGQDKDASGELLPTPQDFLEATLTHVNRTEDLSLAFSSAEVLQTFLSGPAMRLRKLNLAVIDDEDRNDDQDDHDNDDQDDHDNDDQDDHDDEGEDDNDNDNAVEILPKVGRLEALELSNVALPWESGLLSGLSCLVIENDPGINDIRSDQILPILSSSPTLRILFLDISCSDRDLPPPLTVHLPKLEEITLDRCGLNLVQGILSNVKAPACTVVHINVAMEGSQAVTFAQVELLPRFPALHAAVLSSRRSELILGSNGEMVLWRPLGTAHSDKRTELGLTLGSNAGYSTTIEALLPNDLESTDSKLRIHRRFILNPQRFNEETQRALAVKKQFTRVEIDLNPGENDWGIHRFLDRVWEGSAQVTFPCMRSLLIQGSAWSHDLLMNTLDNRAQAQGEVEAGLDLSVDRDVLWHDVDLRLLQACPGVNHVETGSYSTDDREREREVV
ncbi:hypothetical protein FRC04_006576 [Tulasnella sp. 424]|nr:hypothetical protein FRC04_006576 [Tulasnella sp. 424]KAG8960984.1 hypothetical protein FRC05_006422 [Tulasnella sp. 425]